MNSYNECSAIIELDLDPIKVKLMHKASGEGWTLEQANVVEIEYRRFLYMMKVFPNEMLAPSEDVDTFWHYHILDTIKYARDCEDVFGYFLHHFPYLGMRGEDDLAALGQAGNRMAALYEETFGNKFQWSLVSETTPLAYGDGTASGASTLGAAPAYCMNDQAAPAYCMTAKAAPAYCMTTKAAPAYCMTAKAAPAYCMTAKAAPAYCMTAKAAPAYCMTAKAAPAYCMTTTAPAYCMTSATPLRTSAADSARDDISVDDLFLSRPRLADQALAN